MKMKLLGSLLLATAYLAGSGLAASQSFRGHLVLGHEVRSVRPCGDSRTFWLHLEPAVLEILKARYETLVSKPYSEVYVEFEGRHVERSPGAFSEAYDGVIEFHQLGLMSKGPTEPCPQGEPETYVFVCDSGPTVTVRTEGDTAWVFRPEGTLQLTFERPGPPLTYSDESFELRIEGEMAWMGPRGTESLSCRNDRRLAIWEKAKLDGADFRAVGNEPGWHLEIKNGDLIVFVADYGESRIEVPLPTAIEDPESRTTRWQTEQLQLQIVGRSCHDTMSGEAFESEVQVNWDGRTFLGCGRALH